MSLMNRLKSESLSQILRKKFFGSKVDLQANKFEVEVLCASEKQTVNVPIYINSQLSRIKNAVSISTVKEEMDWFFKTDMTHGATQLYKINNVRIGSSGVWFDKTHYLDRIVYKNSSQKSVNIETAILTDADNSSKYFGHWLTDFLPAAIIRYKNYPALSINKPDYFHADSYLKILDINNIIYSNNGFIKELYILDDFFTVNSYKISRLRELSSRIHCKISPEQATYAGVYIVRGTQGEKRHLQNEKEVIEHLSKKGFYILHPEKESVAKIASVLISASFIISIEGSALAHSILSAPRKAAYLILMPPNRCTFFFKAILDALGHAWGIYVCNEGSDYNSFYLDSFDDLDKLIDLIRNRSETRLAS